MYCACTPGIFSITLLFGVATFLQEITTVKELCPDSNVLENFEIKGGVERDGVSLVIKEQKRRELCG